METDGMLETTLGDLIAALTEEATPYFRDEREARNVVTFALMDLLTGSNATSRVRLIAQ